MKKIEILHHIQQITNKLTEEWRSLSEDTKILSQAIGEGEFLVADLSRRIRGELEMIEQLQSACMVQYEHLQEAESLPKKIEEISEFLQKKERLYQEQEHYGRAIMIFLDFASDDPKTQEALDLHQSVLADIDQTHPLSQEDKTMLEDYVSFVAAYEESDAIKLIEYSQSLAKTFENQLISGVVFKNNLYRKSAKDAPIPCEEPKAERTTETESREEAGISVEEVEAELQGVQEETKADIKLYPYMSMRSGNTFSKEEFQQDISGPSVELRRMILHKASIYGGITVGILENLTAASTEKLTEECENLYQMGYLYKYELKDMGIFYSISSRGGKAFLDTDTLQFLQMEQPEQDNYELIRQEKVAMARFMLLHTIAYVQKKLDVEELDIIHSPLAEAFFLEIQLRDQTEPLLYTGLYDDSTASRENYRSTLGDLLDETYYPTVTIVEQDLEKKRVLEQFLKEAALPQLEETTLEYLEETEEAAKTEGFPEEEDKSSEVRENRLSQMSRENLHATSNRMKKFFQDYQDEKKNPAENEISGEKLREAGVEQVSGEMMEQFLTQSETETE